MEVIINEIKKVGDKLMDQGIDKELECQDCGSSFYWTAGEQDFYNKKGFSAPKRCQKCRKNKKFDKGGGYDG